jgi:hypothetical protein
VQASRDLAQPLMSFGQVLSIWTVFLQGAPNLELQTLEKSAFVQALWQNRQSLLNRFQLLKPHQSTPVKGLAAVAIDRISNGLADELFELLEFGIPGSG